MPGVSKSLTRAEDIGPDKYDATATAMIAQLKYGTGVPFTRLERIE